jgi:hypothetical protein
MNARFWTWMNGGWVKITLKPEQELTHFWHGRTDEGYAEQGVTWYHDGDEGIVEQEEWSRGRDCDGRYAHETVSFAGLSQLQARRSAWDGTLFPDWSQQREAHRDYTAEAAGY